ncbi:MAG: DUF2891 domain-containing protein [Candidatus Limnocylindria bacterium]
MQLDRPRRLAMLEQRADEYLSVAIANVQREYPHMPHFVATGREDYRTHRELHPAFYGSYDWHSCVEMHWTIVRLVRQVPDLAAADEARGVLDELLTPHNLAAEAAFFAKPEHRSLERPYGWGWLLTLQHELLTWEHPAARRWAGAVESLADVLTERLVDWLPALTYPQRTGVHPNTAFGLSRSLDYAALRARGGDSALVDAIRTAARSWFIADVDYPAQYEPSGADFLSPALAEAELMSRTLDPRAFAPWLTSFLPGIVSAEPASLFEPARVSDETDGQIAHLHGLNLSRAWMFTAMAERLPDDDARIEPLLEAAGRHAEASLSHVAGSDYAVEHWLAAYATLMLSHGSG